MYWTSLKRTPFRKKKRLSDPYPISQVCTKLNRDRQKNQYEKSVQLVYNINNSKSSLVQARCLKITEKVSFNIASEASYAYILSGQKLINNAKNGPISRVFENLKLAVKQCYQTGQF